MESGLPLLNCLLQQTLKSICLTPNSSGSPKWVYAVFWRILPRNFPPPRWEFGGTALDRSSGDKRNWILVWEDGFCDFNEGELRKGTFGADIFFKMSHEVYSFGEGLVGKMAADNTHKWVYGDSYQKHEARYIASMEPQPRAWEFQFNSGIQSIAVIAVREGVVQLGSFDKIAEDLNLVINIQRKFSYLQSIPGILAIQRPNIAKPSSQLIESKGIATSNSSSMIAIDLGWNHPQKETTGPPLWSDMSCGLGALLSKQSSNDSDFKMN